MSKHELAEAYASGRISRRAFMRGMVALGVSASAVTAHAVALQSTAQAQPDLSEFYPPDLPQLDCASFPPQAQARCEAINDRLAERQERLNDRFRAIRNRFGFP